MKECLIDQKTISAFGKTADMIHHNAILYRYENGCRDIIATRAPIFREPGWESSSSDTRVKPAARAAGKKSEGDDQLRSMRRARAKLRRLALANEFDFFVTLTLDQTRIDRYDPKIITKALNRWLDNMVRRNGIRYVLVPEFHTLKEGEEVPAIHFHGFIAGKNLSAVDSGTIKRPGIKKPMRPRDEAERVQWLAACGQVVYNLPQWTLGYTTALKLHGEYPRAVAYVCKYIGKQQGQRPMGRWYYSGGALKEPPKEYMDVDFDELSNKTDAITFDTPGGKMLVIHTKMEE